MTMEKKVQLGETPLAKNEWAEEQEIFPPETVGEIIIHRNGEWTFEARIKDEAWKIYAAYVEGRPQNFSEYCGEYD